MDTNPDPTLHLLDALQDPERYVCVPGMPVFTPHIRHDEEGNVEALVDLPELQRIADTVNAMIERHGRPVRISCGHVKLHQPGEHPQCEEKDNGIKDHARMLPAQSQPQKGGDIASALAGAPLSQRSCSQKPGICPWV